MHGITTGNKFDVVDASVSSRYVQY